MTSAKYLFSTIIAGLICMTAGCYNTPTALKPGAWMLDQVPKNAPPNFKQGWLDGCQTGLASMTNSYYKTFWHFTQSATLRRDPLYYKTWVDTYNFCRHYAYGTLRQANVRMKLPEESNVFQNNLFGTEGIFESGILQNRGPGTQNLVLENWGVTGGKDFFADTLGSMGGEWDYTNDMFWNGKTNEIMEWDFTPTHSIVPY